MSTTRPSPRRLINVPDNGSWFQDFFLGQGKWFRRCGNPSAWAYRFPSARKLILASCRVRHLSIMPSSVFLVVRVHEGVPGSSCALVSAQPRPQTSAPDRRDTLARRRALLLWRDRDGTWQVSCAWLRVVHRSWSCSEPKATAVFVLSPTSFPVLRPEDHPPVVRRPLVTTGILPTKMLAYSGRR